MKKTFDTLFNEFFREDKDAVAAKNQEIKKVIQTINNFRKINNGELSEEQIEAQLGEPTRVESYIKDNLVVTTLVWQTEQGLFEKVIVTDILPPDDGISLETLKEKLADAVAAEDYPSAIKLRDEIKKREEKII